MGNKPANYLQVNVIFFENYINSLKILKQNILKLKLENKCNIYNFSAYDLAKFKKEDGTWLGAWLPINNPDGA